MVGKNTRGSRYTEPWKSSSFGPRNIGTGHKYTPSQNNVKVKESTIPQDQNRVTTPEREYARQYEGNLDNLLDSWYEHPRDPTILHYMYDSGLFERKNKKLYVDSYIDAWAEKRGISTDDVNNTITKTYYQLNPKLQQDNFSVDSSFLNRNDIYPKSSSYNIKENLTTDIGKLIPLENNTEPYTSKLGISPELANLPVKRKFQENPRYIDSYNESVSGLQPKRGFSGIDLDIGTYSVDPIWRDRYDFPKKPFNWRALVAGGAATAGLTGLGLLAAADYNNRQFEAQTPSQAELENQPESTLEQQYATQNIPSFSSKINNLFDLYQQQEQLVKDRAAYEAYLRAQEMGQRIASGTGYTPELKEGNFVFPQNPPEIGSNIKTAGLKSPNGGKVPQELNRLSGVKPKVIKDTSNGPVVLNDPNHRKSKNGQSNSITPEQAVATQMTNQLANIPVEVIRAKNSGYAQPPLNHATDAIWDRVRKAGLVSPEQGIRSGLFTPDEVRYITENDLWRYR